MKKILLRASMFLLIAFFFFIENSYARENVTDWYVKRLDSQIVINRDSSLNITEKIVADCGEAIGKHGIFRILPEKINIDGKGIVKTPIDLISIKDENGNDYKFTESKNSSDNTVTWKIGDANTTVQGAHIYVIKYRVKNAIRFYDNNFDEFYWNLTGNFWDLEIDSARIEIIFPEEVKKENSTVDIYSGFLGEKGNILADFKWMNSNMLEVNSTGTLAVGQGITTAVTFPKNIFTPYIPSFWEKYGKYFSLLIPVIIFSICLSLWQKYGKDPKLDKTVIAEYKAPKGMSPLEIGLLLSNGTFKNHFITAEIINFATQKILTIREVDNKILFFHSKDYEFTRTNNAEAEKGLNEAQKAILDEVFSAGNIVTLSSLKNSFYKVLADVKKKGTEILINKNLIVKSGLSFATAFQILCFLTIFGGMMLFSVSVGLALATISASIIFLIFSFIMPKRTIEGAQMKWQIDGFKLFMETVDKDRAKFYEEENIFEKFLPYAILFEITDIWIKKIKEIYGEEYFATHVPAWYVGSSLGAFDANNFSSAMTSLSESISANTSAPSGSGGSGGAGGGGGGGGGGGW